jgi:RimJ/RimL family protein N-acetyltransferase
VAAPSLAKTRASRRSKSHGVDIEDGLARPLDRPPLAGHALAMTNAPIATTPRLILRDWAPGDERRFFDVMNKAPVMRWLGGVQSLEQWRSAYQRILGFERDHGHTFWIVERHADGGHLSGEMLGFCGIKRVNAPGDHALAGQHEVGWRLREEAWGKGYAREAATASLDLAFGRFAAPHVVALTVDGNRASWGLMERLGMVRRPDLDFVDPRFGPDLNPTIVYRLEREGWLSPRSAR